MDGQQPQFSLNTSHERLRQQRHSQRSGVTPLGVVLRELLDGWGIQTKVLEAQAVLCWKEVAQEVAGAALSRLSEPLAVRRGTLFVSVEGSVWKHQLSFLKRGIIERLNHRVGGEVIRDIRVVTDTRERREHGGDSHARDD